MGNVSKVVPSIHPMIALRGVTGFLTLSSLPLMPAPQRATKLFCTEQSQWRAQ